MGLTTRTLSLCERKGHRDFHRPVTPQIPLREPGQHYTTPRKAAVLAAIDFCEKSNTSYFKEDVFRTFNVNRKRGYEWLGTGVTRRMHNDLEQEEAWGRKPIVSAEKSGRWSAFWRRKESKCVVLHESS